MKKIFIATLLICLLGLALISCSSAETLTNTVPDIATAVSEVGDIQEPNELTEDNLVYDMGITVENVAEFSGFTTGITGNSGTIVVIKAADGKVADVQAELEAYKMVNADFLSLYPEFASAQTQAENGRIVAKADVVVLAIAGPNADYAAVDTAIEEALQ